MFPTIHLNGTSPESLIEDLEKAGVAIEAAYDALKRCAPNGRDYYPQGPGELEKAAGEHMARLRKLDELQNDISTLIEAINCASGDR